jgi:hypothetical protein
MTRDVDQVAIVVDWLDACRRRDLSALLDLYADGASLECACGGQALAYGRSALEAYWRPRFSSLVPTAFGLKEIAPSADGVVLDYSSYEGKPVRMSFAFSPEGKIRRTSCWPVAAISGNDNSRSINRSEG